jgi:hypothetical protein
MTITVAMAPWWPVLMDTLPVSPIRPALLRLPNGAIQLVRYIERRHSKTGHMTLTQEGLAQVRVGKFNRRDKKRGKHERATVRSATKRH